MNETRTMTRAPPSTQPYPAAGASMRVAITSPAAIPARTPRPPARETSRSCSERSLGRSTSQRRGPRRTSPRVAARAGRERGQGPERAGRPRAPRGSGRASCATGERYRGRAEERRGARGRRFRERGRLTRIDGQSWPRGPARRRDACAPPGLRHPDAAEPGRRAQADSVARSDPVLDFMRLPARTSDIVDLVFDIIRPHVGGFAPIRRESGAAGESRHEAGTERIRGR